MRKWLERFLNWFHSIVGEDGISVEDYASDQRHVTIIQEGHRFHKFGDWE